MDGRPTWTDCDEAGDYVVPNVLSPRHLVFRPDNMDETVRHTHKMCVSTGFCCFYCFGSRILKLQRSKQMGSNEYGNIDLCR